MSVYDEFFAGQTFKKKVATFCSRLGWKLEVLTEGEALASVFTSSGRPKVFIFRRTAAAVELWVPVDVQVEKGRGFRADLVNLLLRQNSTRLLGFWCIVEFPPDKEVLALMHNVFHLNELSFDEFAVLAGVLLEDCDKLESAIYDYALSSNKSNNR